jgi:type VI secretion system protein ImpM
MSGGVGFYGKLPGAGDFVRRRLPSDFVDAWDRHFQRAVETGRREMGQRWTTAWRQGPAWRFLLPPQVCGNSAWCGLTGPAVDRLGRAFPMVLAAPSSGDVTRILSNHAWFDTLESVYRSAQHEAASVETFDSRVAALPRPLAGTTDLSALWSGLPWDGGQWQLERPGATAAGLMLAEAWRQLGTRPGPWCLWWNEGAARLLATRGLPRSHAALLEWPRSQEYDAAGFVDASGVRCAAGPQPTTPAPHEATETVRSDWLADDVPAIGDAMLWFDDGRTLVLSADDGPYDPRRLAARGIREAVAASAPDAASLRASLMLLHSRLRGVSHGTATAANENGAAVVVRFDGAYAHLLRVGAAALWHWRRGQLQAPFVERAVGAGGEFDDLLFGDAWLHMPGIGTAGEPDSSPVTVWYCSSRASSCSFRVTVLQKRSRFPRAARRARILRSAPALAHGPHNGRSRS